MNTNEQDKIARKFRQLYKEEDCLDSESRKRLQEIITRFQFDSRENDYRHDSLEKERREFAAVENGDPDALQKCWSETEHGNIVLHAGDEVRSIKDLGVIILTLGSRAAIRGGLPVETAFAISDIYIDAIEKSPNADYAMRLARDSEYLYCKLVREIHRSREGQSKESTIRKNYADQVKNYVASHLHGKITVTEIAAALSVNADYLSRIFNDQEGISLSDYIREEKIAAAKNLLVYSEYSYLEIANYLGFCSQSHLGARFKEATGMTMAAYRKTYRSAEFISK